MTEVYIDQQRVFFKENTNLKLTIENTFFEDAGSYTLDVIFPLHIEENIKAFGAINRLDVSKRYKTFDAMIVVDSRVVFKGTAKITNISDAEVKLQMLSGNSHVKFWTKAQKMYIDEFQYEYTDKCYSFDHFVDLDYFDSVPFIVAGSFPGKKGIFCYVPILDENGSADQVLNRHQLIMDNNEFVVISHGSNPDPHPSYVRVYRESICPNLMFVTRWILGHLGYSIRRNDRDNEFVNSIYIATATRTTKNSTSYNMKCSSEEKAMAKALPHWTVEEFIKQLQNFLNVTVVFNDIDGTADIISSAFTEGTVDISNNIQDEFEVEVIDDADVEGNLYDSNVRYKEGASEYHGTDIVDREIISSFNEIHCTVQESLTQWDNMSAEEKKMAIWTTESGQFCAKIVVGEDGKETLERIRFNHFGAIIRNTENEDDVELKISPVATTTEIKMSVYTYYGASGGKILMDQFNVRDRREHTVLCLQNNYEAASKPTVWDAINGTQEDGSEKEDIMQVFLMDDKAVPTGFYYLTFQTPFTHWGYNRPNKNVEHKNWSLALANDDSACYIGSYHEAARRHNRNAELRVKFTADRIPSVYAVFLIRNKQYACKKLEVQFGAEGMEKVINGYFEEIL